MLLTIKENGRQLIVPCWVVTFFVDEECKQKQYFFFGGEFSAARGEAYAWLKWQPENCWEYKIEYRDITYVMSE